MAYSIPASLIPTGSSAYFAIISDISCGTDEPDRETQKKWFIKQLELAKELSLPVVIHSRDAAEDTLNILKRPEYISLRGIIHCFSYSLELAREYVKMGYFIGVGGVVTFKNSRKIKEVLENIPIEHIVLKTDCPYMAPVPLRGTRNDPGNLSYVADKIAELKNMTSDEVIRITTENAKRVYRIG